MGPSVTSLHSGHALHSFELHAHFADHELWFPEHEVSQRDGRGPRSVDIIGPDIVELAEVESKLLLLRNSTELAAGEAPAPVFMQSIGV